MKSRYVFLVLTIAFSALLIGCSRQERKPEAVAVPANDKTGLLEELQRMNRLALGTLKLEGTENAVTPAQAGELLPLWTIIQGGSLQGQAETDAVLEQIEAKMTESQRAVIDAMELTFQDLGTWMQEQGTEMPTPPVGQDGRGQGGPGAFQNMTEEERNRLREEFQDMTPGQRATRMTEMGFQRPGGVGQGGAPGARRGFGGGAGGNFLLDPLLDLLTNRAAE